MTQVNFSLAQTATPMLETSEDDIENAEAHYGKTAAAATFGVIAVVSIGALVAKCMRSRSCRNSE